MPKVIIADDEEYVRHYLKTILKSMKYDVIAEVQDGSNLYELMKKKNPDILLLDINMPEVTGIDFLTKYHRNFPKTCIIVLTSLTSFRWIMDASELGISSYIQKDVSTGKMVESIKKAWDEFRTKR